MKERCCECESFAVSFVLAPWCQVHAEAYWRGLVQMGASLARARRVSDRPVVAVPRVGIGPAVLCPCCLWDVTPVRIPHVYGRDPRLRCPRCYAAVSRHRVA